MFAITNAFGYPLGYVATEEIADEVIKKLTRHMEECGEEGSLGCDHITPHTSVDEAFNDLKDYVVDDYFMMMGAE